jgi:hypothetical protein
MCEARLLERAPGDFDALAGGGKQDHGKTIEERRGSRQTGAGRQRSPQA